MDTIVAYSPQGVGLTSGMLGVLVAPNKIVGVALVIAGSTVDTVTTWWDRRQKRRSGDAG
ncbi:hypothetical protein [Micromonospora sp. NPDC005173]|uniref:hypothetical protein n=1 Tax=Micromonospora sp. NPDC005173 TaxID=3157165 RepID=UPI0033A5A819